MIFQPGSVYVCPVFFHALNFMLSFLEMSWLLVEVLHSFLMNIFPEMYDPGVLEHGAFCHPAGWVGFVPHGSRVSQVEQRWHCIAGFVVGPLPTPQVALPAVARVMDNPGNLSGCQELPCLVKL